MCIVVYKPVGKKLPSEKTLKTCFENNDDGAGFMYAHGGNVHIRKGYMTFKAFYNALKGAAREVGERETPFVLHFRISTQAGVRKDCTHPFPLSSNLNDLRKLRVKSHIGIAHNGIIPVTSSTAKNLDYNDTMRFITDYLSLIIKNKRYYTDKATLKLIERLSDSKLAILDSDGHCELIGEWVEEQGVFYSNGSYREDYGLFSRYYYPYSYDEFDRYINEETGYYDFDKDHCPVWEFGDFEWCGLCSHYPNCGNL